jgi:hypothetical protein
MVLEAREGVPDPMAFLRAFVDADFRRVPACVDLLVKNLCNDAPPMSLDAVTAWLASPNWAQWSGKRRAQIVKLLPLAPPPAVEAQLTDVFELLDMLANAEPFKMMPLSDRAPDIIDRSLVIACAPLLHQIYSESKKAAFAPVGARIRGGDRAWVGKFSRAATPTQKASYGTIAVAWRARVILAEMLTGLKADLAKVHKFAITPGVEEELLKWIELGTTENATLFNAFAAAAVIIFKDATDWTDHRAAAPAAVVSAAVEPPVPVEAPAYTPDEFPYLQPASDSEEDAPELAAAETVPELATAETVPELAAAEPAAVAEHAAAAVAAAEHADEPVDSWETAHDPWADENKQDPEPVHVQKEQKDVSKHYTHMPKKPTKPKKEPKEPEPAAPAAPAAEVKVVVVVREHDARPPRIILGGVPVETVASRVIAAEAEAKAAAAEAADWRKPKGGRGRGRGGWRGGKQQ